MALVLTSSCIVTCTTLSLTYSRLERIASTFFFLLSFKSLLELYTLSFELPCQCLDDTKQHICNDNSSFECCLRDISPNNIFHKKNTFNMSIYKTSIFSYHHHPRNYHIKISNFQIIICLCIKIIFHHTYNILI